MTRASVRKVRHQRKIDDLDSVRVYISTREKRLIEKAAKLAGLSVSAFCAPLLVQKATDFIVAHPSIIQPPL